MTKLWITAGCWNLITALIHIIMGHYLLILPFVELEFRVPLKAILHACWQLVY